MNTVNLNVRISEELRETFYQTCDEKGLSVSEAIRQLMEEFIRASSVNVQIQQDLFNDADKTRKRGPRQSRRRANIDQSGAA